MPLPMNSEYSPYCRDLSALLVQYSACYRDIRFHERDQAVEVFAMQSLSMTSCALRAASLLLDNSLTPEAILVTRSIQELLFDLRWILSTTDRAERLERTYCLEGGPYRSWQKETELIRADAERRSDPPLLEQARRWSEPLNDIASRYPHLVVSRADGSYTFKSPPPFTSRMTGTLRLKFYHLYRFTSLFAHPTPMTKEHYLRASDGSGEALTPESETIKQSLAYTLLMAELVVGSAEEILASFAPESAAARQTIYVQIVEIVKRANRGYFSNP
jgi:hypothetical protein